MESSAFYGACYEKVSFAKTDRWVHFTYFYCFWLPSNMESKKEGDSSSGQASGGNSGGSAGETTIVRVAIMKYLHQSLILLV